MADGADWEVIDGIERAHLRTHNAFSWGTLTLGDDSQPIQNWQLNGYQGEGRDGVRRVSEFGHTSMPLPGAAVAVLYQGGSRSRGVIIGVEDPRYRPTGLKGGESGVYIVDGAGADGTGGTLRWLMRGALTWINTIFGKTINIGDESNVTIVVGSSGNTMTIDIYAKTDVTVHAPLIVATNGGTPSWVETVAGPSTVLKADA